MMVLVTYDVRMDNEEGKSRLRRVAKACEDYGQRVQNSVFECLIDPLHFAVLKSRLLKIINNKKDSIRFYMLGKKWESKIESYGKYEGYNPEGTLII